DRLKRPSRFETGDGADRRPRVPPAMSAECAVNERFHPGLPQPAVLRTPEGRATRAVMRDTLPPGCAGDGPGVRGQRAAPPGAAATAVLRTQSRAHGCLLSGVR